MLGFSYNLPPKEPAENPRWFLSHSFPAAQSGQNTIDLEPNRPIERELPGGQRHNYHVALSEGQYIRVEIDNKGTDVGVNFQLPSGRIINQYLPFGGQPRLSFSWVAESTGVYTTTVYAGAKASPGSYAIRLADLRPATEQDRSLQQARDFFAEYVKLKHAGKFSEAESSLSRALEIRESILGPNDLAVAETLGFVASGYGDAGDFAKAEPIHLRVLKITEMALGHDHPRVAVKRLALATFYSDKGDDIKAEENYRRALAIYEKNQMLNDPSVAAVLAGIGQIFYSRGDYENAERYYEQSREVWAKLFGPDHFHLAGTYTHLGRVAYDAGNYAKAEAMFKQALALADKGLGRNNPKVTPFANDLADVYSTTGSYDKAESLYRQSIAIHEQQRAMGDPAVQESLFGLARCYAAQGRAAEAVASQSEASEIEARYIALNLTGGSEREKLAFLDNLTARTYRNISLHANLATTDQRALTVAVNTILREKGRVQDAMSASLAAMHRRSGTEDQELLDQLNDTRSKLANLVLNGPQKLTLPEHQAQILNLEHRLEELEADISRRSAGFYERALPVTLGAVQGAIPGNAALIEFAVYRPFDPKAPDNQKAYGEPRYVAYIIRHQGEPQWRDLGSAKEIDERTERLRKALRDPQCRDVRTLARGLDEHLMLPLRALVGDVTQLLISPDGNLNLLPFEALLDEHAHYLIERFSITYLTSGRDLLRMRVARESKSSPLIIANPLFGEPDRDPGTTAIAKSMIRRRGTAVRNLSDYYFAPLDGTAQEAQAIKALFPEADVLMRRQATETALKKAAAPSILHIATHGFFLEDSELAASGSSPTANRGISAKPAIENPLLRSGLAFAGANLRKAGEDNGILTALEASGLNLWGTKLVTLSACDTGLGEVRNGEGVYGMRRSLTLAGAESLVISLWAVSDYVTRQMMIGYYKGLKQGLGRGESLRQVKLSLLKQPAHQHPYYWASFIQSGEWANLDGKR